MVTLRQAELLRRLTIGDPATLTGLLTTDRGSAGPFDARTASLVRLGALITLDAATPAYQSTISSAYDAGVSIDEILATLVELAPLVGTAAVMTAAPKVGFALGYDVEAALGEPDDDERSGMDV